MHLYDNLSKRKLWCWGIYQWLPGFAREGCGYRGIAHGHTGVFWSDGTVMYSDCCGGCIDFYICLNS